MTDRWTDPYFVLHWSPGGLLHRGDYLVESFETIEQARQACRTQYDFLVQRVPAEEKQ